MNESMLIHVDFVSISKTDNHIKSIVRNLTKYKFNQKYLFNPANVTRRQIYNTSRVLMVFNQPMSIETTAFELEPRNLDIQVNTPHRSAKATHQLQAIHWNSTLARCILSQWIKEHVRSKQLAQVELFLKEFGHIFNSCDPAIQSLEMLNNSCQVGWGVFWAIPLVLPTARCLLEFKNKF